MSLINWGILATGNIAHSFVQDFTFVNRAKVKAVASRSLSKAKKFAHHYGIDRFYGDYASLMADPDVDVIYIATPHNSHFELLKEAIHQKKPVVCEKPITINSEQFQRVIKMARESNIYVMETLWTYFLPPIRTAMDWINQEMIRSFPSGL